MPEHDADIGETTDQAAREAEKSRASLVESVRWLLEALEACAGDDPDCPYCGPAREFAKQVLDSVERAPGVSPAQRLTIQGRVGAEPTFGRTRAGVAVARFPLGVRTDEGVTVWQLIVAFGPRAERLRGALSKGQRVEVIGYVHEREARAGAGATRTVREVYAAVTRPLRASR